MIVVWWAYHRYRMDNNRLRVRSGVDIDPIARCIMVGGIKRSQALLYTTAIVLAGVLFSVLYAFIGTFILGLFLYYASRPIYVRLRYRLRPASMAAAVSLFLLVLPVILLFWYTATLGFNELRSLTHVTIANSGPLLPNFTTLGVLDEVNLIVDATVSNPDRILQENRLRTVVMGMIGTVTNYIRVILTGLLHLFISVTIAFYLLRDGDGLASWVTTQMSDDTLIEYGRAIDSDLKTIYFGNILNALLTGIIGAFVFWILAEIAPAGVPVPVPILLGLLVGAGSLIPVVGMKIVYIPVTVFLGVQALLVNPKTLWFPLMFFGVTFILVDTIPDIVLRPYVSGRNLHVGMVMFVHLRSVTVWLVRPLPRTTSPRPHHRFRACCDPGTSRDIPGIEDRYRW